MRSRALSLSLVFAVVAVPVVVSCSGPVGGEGDGGETGGIGFGGASGVAPTGGVPNGGTPTGGVSGATTGGVPTGGASGAAPGGAAPGGAAPGGAAPGGAAGAPPVAGNAGAIIVAGSGGTGAGGSGAGGAGTGGAGMGGAPGGGKGGMGGSFVAGGMGGGPVVQPLNCGGKGTAVENHGPPSNRVNYVIVGDGYSDAQLAQGGTLDMHVQTMTAKMYSDPIGQPFLRYRNFINICVLKIPSTPICGSSTFGCCGSDSSRLATCNSSSVTNALSQNLPASFEVTWRAVVLNGSSWWNTGSSLMLWSGGNRDAAGAALHEGGHGFNQLADEYTGTNSGCTTEYAEVNSTAANNGASNPKWGLWNGYNQAGATGMQGFVAGSRYCTAGQYRPSQNSMMNSLFGNNVNTSFNSVSREQIVFSIWRNGGGARALTPIDSTEPPAGAADNPTTLRVNVIDPAVISVDWTVDGVTTMNGGPSFSTASLSAGTHMITARAYDNASMDLVRYRTGTCPSTVTGNYCHRTGWNNATQTVAWTVTKR